jgi:hypothetical protein
VQILALPSGSYLEGIFFVAPAITLCCHLLWRGIAGSSYANTPPAWMEELPLRGDWLGGNFNLTLSSLTYKFGLLNLTLFL